MKKNSYITSAHGSGKTAEMLSDILTRLSDKPAAGKPRKKKICHRKGE